MLIFKENHFLVPVKCYYNESLDCFVFKFSGKTISIQNVTDEKLAAVFRRSKMKDEETEPRSLRGKTYLDMVLSIKNGTDKINFVWNNFVSVFETELLKLRQFYQG